MEHDHRIVSERGIAVLDNVRRICSALPETEEVIDGFGHTVCKVKGKSFIMMGEYEGRGSLSFKSDKETQQLLIQQGTYTKTPYIGQHGWVSIAFGDEIDWDELGPLLEEAYLRAAPKRLAQRVMADRDAPE